MVGEQVEVLDAPLVQAAPDAERVHLQPRSAYGPSGVVANVYENAPRTTHLKLDVPCLASFDLDLRFGVPEAGNQRLDPDVRDAHTGKARLAP